MIALFYILDRDNNPVGLELSAEGTLERIEEWYSDLSKRSIGLAWLGGGWRCSTVFLTVDHNHSGEGPPILFETMVLSPGYCDLYCRRYATIQDARRGHREVLARFRFKARVLSKKLHRRERRAELFWKRVKDRGPARNHGRFLLHG